LNVREEVTGPVVDALFRKGELLERTLSDGLVIEFPYRSKIARDFVMSSMSEPDHVWEPQTTKLLLALGASAKEVIVGGAYFGDQAIPLAKSILPRGGRVHCFDLNEEQLGLLTRNAKRNDLPNVIANLRGLWDKGERRLVLVGDDSHAYAKEDVENGTLTVTIEDYAAAHGIQAVDLIVLDVEGAEHAALRGAERFLRQEARVAPHVVFEVHRSYVDWTNGLERIDIVRFLRELGYTVYAVRDYQSNVDMRGRPVELVPLTDIYLDGPPHGFNMLATKDVGIVERIGLRIVPGVSPKLLFHRDPTLHAPLT
jgi:FkbM family methyltransferase